jgi:hypothetical protein
MNKQTIVIMIMGIIILSGVGVYAYQQIEKKSYEQGFQDAGLYINQQIVSNLMQQGFINVIVPINNEQGNSTYQVKLIVGNSTKIK